MVANEIYGLRGNVWTSFGRTSLGVATAWPYGSLGSYKPSVTTTGYGPTGQALTLYPASGGPYGNIVSGVLTINTPGAILNGYDIPAQVVLRAANIIIRKSLIRGAAAVTTGADVGLVDSSNISCTNALLEDCTLSPTNPSAWMNGVRGDNITVQRCDISDVCDGMDLYSGGGSTGIAANTAIYANYIHDLAGYSPDSVGRSFSHNDCIQLTDGTGVTIRYNSLQGFLDPAVGQAATNPNHPAMNTNSAMQITQGTGIITGMLIDSNWLDGGGATINLAPTGQTARNLGSITNNKFGRASYFQGGGAGTDGSPGSGGDNSITILSAGGLTYTSTAGNTYEDNGHAVTLRIS